MTTTYYRRRREGLYPLFDAGVLVSSDDTPTLHYYGTVEAARPLSLQEQEDYDLVPCTPEAVDNEAEAGALYRAETGYMA